MDEKQLKNLGKIFRQNQTVMVEVDLEGKKYWLSVYHYLDGHYSVSFGGRLGKVDELLDLFNRLNIVKVLD